jgi:DNA-binding LacI/PurR family transcriptional regulator
MLAKNFNVSLVTMQRSLKLLTQANLLVRKPGRGTFVSKNALKYLKHKNLGIIMPGLGLDLSLSQSPGHYLIFDGIHKYCHGKSWDVQIISKKGDTFSWDKISRHNLSGLIIVFPNRLHYGLISDIKKHNFPLFCINLYSETINREVNFINVDYHSGTINAVEYLHGKGKKNIAIVSYQEKRDDFHQYYIINGYRQTVKRLGLKENIITIDTGGESYLSLIDKFFRQNLQKISEYDAIISMDGDTSFSLCNILKENKIKVPEDISLITFFENEKSCNAGISSYMPDYRSIGYKCASLLFNEETQNSRQLRVKLDFWSRLSA